MKYESHESNWKLQIMKETVTYTIVQEKKKVHKIFIVSQVLDWPITPGNVINVMIFIIWSLMKTRHLPVK